MRRKTLLSWSSGKDSAWTLHTLRQDPTVDLVGLFSVVNERHNRVSMHSTREALLCLQAEATGLDLHKVDLPDPCTDEIWEELMREFTSECATKNIECIAFGDLFLEDLRNYREKQLVGAGIKALFPLWQIPTAELAGRMLGEGLEAYISSIDLKKMPISFVGRKWSEDLLKDLPDGIDPCGENGEMHTIVVNGPMFNKRIEVSVGEVVERDGFAYADIIPVN